MSELWPSFASAHDTIPIPSTSSPIPDPAVIHGSHQQREGCCPEVQAGNPPSAFRWALNWRCTFGGMLRTGNRDSAIDTTAGQERS